MSEKIYDYIVYGAGMPAVIFAVKKSAECKSVLLLNKFGFTGGCVTECLSCYQKINYNELSKTTKVIYDSITSGVNFPLWENASSVIINPEPVKIILQKKLEDSDVDLLFHVIPKFFNIGSDNLGNLTLLGKEGNIIVKGRKFIDASDSYTLKAIKKLKRTVKERAVNIFITSPRNDKFLSFKNIKHALLLRDGRYWISLAIDAGDEMFTENVSHEILEKFSAVLEKSGSRIQILPVRSQSIYLLNENVSNNDIITTVDEITGKTFGTEEQFLKVTEIENNMEKF